MIDLDLLMERAELAKELADQLLADIEREYDGICWSTPDQPENWENRGKF